MQIRKEGYAKFNKFVWHEDFPASLFCDSQGEADMNEPQAFILSLKEDFKFLLLFLCIGVHRLCVCVCM